MLYGSCNVIGDVTKLDKTGPPVFGPGASLGAELGLSSRLVLFSERYFACSAYASRLREVKLAVS